MLMESNSPEEGVVKKRYQRRGGKTTLLELQNTIQAFMDDLDKWKQSEDKSLGFLSLTHVMKLIDQQNQNRVLYLSRKEVDKEENLRKLNEFREKLISGVYRTIQGSPIVDAKPLPWLYNKEKVCLPESVLTKSQTTMFRTFSKLTKGGGDAEYNSIEFNRFLNIISRLDYRIHAEFWNRFIPTHLPALNDAVDKKSKDHIKHEYWPYYISTTKKDPTIVMSLAYTKFSELKPLFEWIFDFNYMAKVSHNALPSVVIIPTINGIRNLLKWTKSIQVGEALYSYTNVAGDIYRCWLTNEKNKKVGVALNK